VLGECRRAAPPSLTVTQHQKMCKARAIASAEHKGNDCEAVSHAPADGFKQFEGHWCVELSPKADTYVGGFDGPFEGYP
jgi:hypothetical protein